jgi:hypothetical protein
LIIPYQGIIYVLNNASFCRLKFFNEKSRLQSKGDIALMPYSSLGPNTVRPSRHFSFSVVRYIGFNNLVPMINEEPTELSAETSNDRLFRFSSVRANYHAEPAGISTALNIGAYRNSRGTKRLRPDHNARVQASIVFEGKSGNMNEPLGNQIHDVVFVFILLRGGTR